MICQMQRHKFVVAVTAALLSACGSTSSSGDTAATTPDSTAAPAATTTSAAATTTVAAAPAETDAAPVDATAVQRPEELRNVRYCEVLLLGKEGDDFVAHVWNTMGHSDCPQADWEALDPVAIAAEQGVPLALLNGPRYWTLDSIDATMQFEAPVTSFGAIEMFEAATVNLGSGAFPSQDPYVERQVARETVFRFDAGSEVYELTSPDGRVYVMQSYSLQADPTQTIDTLSSIGERLALPAGWSFSSRVLDEPLELLSTDRVATVVRDDLQNTYQRNDALLG